MAFTATTQLAQREAALLNARAQQQYNTYLSDLARNFGIAEGNLNANLEGRGIYRSGEASTARTRLSAENQALKSKALQDLEYQKNMNNINLMKQLAALQSQALPASTPAQPPAPANKSPYGTPPVVIRSPYQKPDFMPKTGKPIAASESRRVSNVGR